jgi:hypothetical protein
MKDYLAAVRIQCRLRAGEIDGEHKVTDERVSMRALTLGDIEKIIDDTLPATFPDDPEGAFNLLKLFPKVILKDAVKGPIWQSIHDQGKVYAFDVARKQALRDAGELFGDFDMFQVEQALDLANAVSKSRTDRLPAFESMSDGEMTTTGSKLVSTALEALRANSKPGLSRRHWEAVRRIEEAETYLKLIRMGHATFKDTREISLPPEEVDDELDEASVSS